MKNVPHWQWLVLVYLLIVGVPVFLMHNLLKKRALSDRTFGNLFLYFIGVVGTGFILHYACIWLYFTFVFKVKN
ncbi:MAG TPA: hypothetical protein VF623_07410 [Segetibacter sp.]|jgi:hypothetical protein